MMEVGHHGHATGHVRPEDVGNTRRILISELSGKSNVQQLASDEGIDLGSDDDAALRNAVQEIKRLENQGYVFEGAEASSSLILLRSLKGLEEFFTLVTYRTVVDHRASGGTLSEATVKIRVGGEEHLTVGEGLGPVDALDQALRSAIRRFFPEVKAMRLRDYKVRVINADQSTHAKVRVMIETVDSDTGETWGTVGANENIIEASWHALADGLVVGLLRHGIEA